MKTLALETGLEGQIGLQQAEEEGGTRHAPGKHGNSQETRWFPLAGTRGTCKRAVGARERVGFGRAGGGVGARGGWGASSSAGWSGKQEGQGEGGWPPSMLSRLYFSSGSENQLFCVKWMEGLS